LTELILDNTLGEFEPEEIVALLSAFVFEEKTDVEPQISPRLEEVSPQNYPPNEQGKEIILRVVKRVNDIQERHQVILSGEGNDFEARPRFGLMEVVYEWARGMSFQRITDLTDVLEGTIVRVITRIDETCREVKSAARLIGDASLYAKMEEAQEKVKRDIVFAASLWLG
jgi:antiviral helicase SKI2